MKNVFYSEKSFTDQATDQVVLEFCREPKSANQKYKTKKEKENNV